MDDYIERPPHHHTNTRHVDGGKHPASIRSNLDTASIRSNLDTASIRSNLDSRRRRQFRRLTARRSSIVALFVALMVAATGCLPSTQKGPLHDSTMVDLLIELHLAVARAETTNEFPPNIRDSILTAYNVDSTTYVQAITYYAERPEKYAEIYSRVLDSLNSERIPLRSDVYDERAAEAPSNP